MGTRFALSIALLPLYWRASNLSLPHYSLPSVVTLFSPLAFAGGHMYGRISLRTTSSRSWTWCGLHSLASRCAGLPAFALASTAPGETHRLLPIPLMVYQYSSSLLAPLYSTVAPLLSIDAGCSVRHTYSFSFGLLLLLWRATTSAAFDTTYAAIFFCALSLL